MTKKKKGKKKGFTLVELLAIIVIVGILTTLAIVGTSRYISTAQNQKVKQDRDNIAMAAKLYLQDNRDLLPHSMGESIIVRVSELRRTNYLKEDVKDKNGKDCVKKSFVRVYKMSDKDYSYHTYLYCGDDLVPDEPVVPVPVILDFKFNGYSAGSNFSNVKNATFSFKIKGDNEGYGLGVYSYSYSIFAKTSDSDGYTEVYYSGDLKAGNESEIQVSSKKLSSYFDVTSYNAIRINITAINEQGGKVEFNSSGSFKDTDNPICGLVTGQALSDDDWINKSIFNAGAYKNNFRRVSVGCSDGDGSGCKRDTFTVSWPNDTGTSASGIDYSFGTRWSYIQIEDNAQTANKTICYVRANVDVLAPRVTVKAYKVNADGSKGAQVGSITVQDDGKRTSDLPIGTLKAQQFTGVTGTSSEKWMNKDNFPNGIVLDVSIDDNLYLYSYEWSVNNPYVAGGTKDADVQSTASIHNSQVEQNGGTPVTGNFESPNLVDNPTNMEELKNAEHGIQNGTITGLVLKREGKRYGKLVVCDKAGNCTTVNIFANIDRTAPLIPRVSYSKSTSGVDYTAADANNYKEHTLWSNEYLKAYVDGQREDLQTEDPDTKVSLSGFDHFVASYRKQTGKNGQNLTWAASATSMISAPFSGTSRYGIELKDQGTHRVAFLSCDRAGNCSAYSDEDYPKIDTIRPTCDIVTTYSGATGPNDAGWLKSGESVRLSHSCLDEDNKFSSGCNADSDYNKQSYNFDKDINTTKAGANGYESTYAAGDNSAGGHVVDYAGNISNECPKMTLKIDHIAPDCETVISYPQGNPLHPTTQGSLETGWLGLVGGTGPTKKTAVVSLKCTDVKSTTSNGHMANVESTCNNNHADNKQNHIYGSEMNINNAGAVAAGKGGQVRDIAGNITQCPADRTVKIDYTIPVCTTAIDYGVGSGDNFTPMSNLVSQYGWLGNSYVSNTTDKEKARVTQVCTDPNGSQKSGCDGVIKSKIYASEMNTTQAGAVSIGDNGTVADNAGNKANCTGFHTVRIDYTDPRCEVTMSSKGNGNGKSWLIANYAGTWVGKGATVTVRSTCTADETGKGNSSGCATDVSYDYKNEINTTSATSAGDGGTVIVRDKADNYSGPCPGQTVKIDLTGPTCDVKSTVGSSDYNGMWLGSNSSVTVTSKCTADPLSIGGAGSGCSETANHSKTYSIRSGQQINGQKGSASNEGGYVITDKVGNPTTCGTKLVRLDGIAPSCNVKSTANGWTNAASVIVSRTCSDSGSGCANNINNCNQTPDGCVVTPELPACANGTTTAQEEYKTGLGTVLNISDASADGRSCRVTVYDNVGNSAVCAYKNVKIDREAPSCTIAQSPTGWTNGTVTIQGTCKDGAGSGCKTTAAQLKDTYSDEMHMPVTFSKTIEDNAGNTAQCVGYGYGITIDKTKPSCDVSKTNTISTSGVTIDVSCSDTGGSGVASCDGSASTSRHYTNVTRGRTYNVKDGAGNTNSCSSSVSSKKQNRSAYCSSCKTCSSAGCSITPTCTSSSCCGTTTTSYFIGYTYSTCASTYGSNCTESNYIGTRASCTCTKKVAKTCTKSCCPCPSDKYNASCGTCGGCNNGLSYGGWYDGSRAAGWSGSTHYEQRTVYY